MVKSAVGTACSDRTAGASGRINAPNGIPDCFKISFDRGKCFTDILIKLGPVSPSSIISTGVSDEGMSFFAAFVVNCVTFVLNIGLGICRGSIRLSLLGFGAPEVGLAGLRFAFDLLAGVELIFPRVGGPLFPATGAPSYLLPFVCPALLAVGGPG